ncbi:transcriptional regulator [Acrocarpospora sp. B8E8]|uniref:transcriptional regulator n=1 Tax=Acrocarpospora sp. B8E8 TaxID=3153572 RepID=UPI00325C6556
MAARIEFFDLQQPAESDVTLISALQAAGEADDALLGAAILAHAAFIPGWAGQLEDALERIRAARTYARRGNASADFLAWLYAVEAECETRCGRAQQALTVIGRAADLLTSENQHSPAWFDWFSAIRLNAFKGNTQLRAGHLPQARQTLEGVLEELPVVDVKQRTVVLGDLAAVEAADHSPEAACQRAQEALDLLSVTWYAAGMDRIRNARRALQQWNDLECVQRLDDRLYEWRTTINALQH